ncbi:MAG: alginate lyase family protein [Candidatus Schekmanbacteria bacterium]|nr:alginate lyase family protein [Candidatus Schekmanbacteria bacterium]
MEKLKKILQLPWPDMCSELYWEFERRRRLICFQISNRGTRYEIRGTQKNLKFTFFLQADKQAEYRQILPQAQEILQAAEGICCKQFSIFGRNLDLSAGIDWQRDYLGEHRWDEKERYFPVERNIARIQLGQGADIKVPWELSRFQWALILGQAYWLTGEEKFAQSFTALLNDWIEHNPPYRGINWCSPMEAAIRAANLIWAYHFFSTGDNFISLLELHGRFIYAQPEKWFESSGNHLLANLAGLIYLGIFLGREKWLNFAVKELIRQMDVQVLHDGVDFEASIGYHRLALECFFYPALLCRINHIDLPPHFWEKLKRMFAYVRSYIKPTGQAPQLGDNDSGRLHDFSPILSNDHSYLAALGRLAYVVPSPLETVSQCSYLIHQVQPVVPDKSGNYNIANISSANYPQGGVYIMRSDKAYLMVNCGGNGFYDKGCHAHNDKLSFELNYRGQDFIVDPGSFLYTSQPEERNLFRSTSYHNTVKVDSQEQNRIAAKEMFYLAPDSHPKLIDWQSTDQQDIFCARHDGYARLNDPVIHQRRIVFDKKRSRWEITDTLQGSDIHLLEWYLQLAPEVEITRMGAGQILLTNHGQSLALSTPQPVEIINSFYSPHYGAKIKTQALTWEIKVKLPYSSVFTVEGEK